MPAARQRRPTCRSALDTAGWGDRVWGVNARWSGWLAVIPLLIASVALATSYLITFERKVDYCPAILRVTVTNAALINDKPPFTSQIAVCEATILEILKGSPEIKSIQFRFHPYEPEKLQQLVSNQFLVFLHQPPLPDRPTNQYWVFEGPKGIRPIAEKYTEARVSQKGEIVYDEYTHSNYLAAIRSLVSKQK
jgi:hypothetical protein